MKIKNAKSMKETTKAPTKRVRVTKSEAFKVITKKVKKSKVVSRKDLMEDMIRVKLDLGRYPSLEDLNSHGKYELDDYRSHFNSFKDATKEVSAMTSFKDMLSKDLLKLYETLDRRPTRNEFLEASKFSFHDVVKAFGSFTDFCDKVLPVKAEPTKEELLNDVVVVSEKLNKMPSRREMRDHGTYPTYYYEKHFGTFSDVFDHLKDKVSVYEPYNKCWQLEGNVMLTSDWHVPYYDVDLCNKMLQIKEKFGITRLIIAGDFFNQDAFSHYVNMDVAKWGDERMIATDIMDVLTQEFDDIYILTGNHDIRLLKTLSYKLSNNDMWRMVHEEIGKSIHVTEYPFLRLNKRWHITHPKNYSKIPVTVARQLNYKYQCNVGVAHGHQMGVAYSPSGKEVLFDTGGMYDQDKIEYHRMTDTTHFEWQSGFSVIYNNFLYQFPKEHTDWDFWFKRL